MFRTASAPRDKTDKPLILQGWTLRNYIDFAHDVNRISSFTKFRSPKLAIGAPPNPASNGNSG